MARSKIVAPVAALVVSTCLTLAAAPDGKQLFETHCASCHGKTGEGNGPAAVWLYPKPRNFASGLFKIKSTPAGALPTDDDLLRTVTRGMPGSSMPDFTYLTEAERRAAVQYVKALSVYTDERGKRVNFFEEAGAKGPPPAPISVPTEPPVTLQTLTQGKQTYTKLQCFLCHGVTGEGTGPSAPTLKDVWGFSLSPRDFNNGAFRGGHTGRDLYLRVATGLAGTPMPSFGDDLVSPQQRWSVVHYIQSLRRKSVEINDILQPADGFIRAQRVSRKLPTHPADALWDRMDPTRVPLNPLWAEPDPIPAVAVRAVYDGSRIAFLLQWHDAIANGAPVRVQDFQDAVAMQFALKGAIPFLGMGDADNPVNLWQWKAGWQQEVEGERPDVSTIYASMHVDRYPETGALFRTAEAAGNLLAFSRRRSPVEDANAHGFGTLESQPAKGQNVMGKGIWRDGYWSVVLVRTLKSADAQDAQFIKGTPIPVAFAVWNGEQRDRNGRKVVSNWYRLILEP
ncbi:MAG: c-type cytochrome [Verrucomicrobia bacterium]|nr:c-type cytochrome [Verrucomicrobiota bacterium]